jgi:glycosyltransferase involved in cell wall biosynthesis
MRIGIDATSLPPQPVGAGNYMIYLIRALAEVNDRHELIVFAQPGGRALVDLPESKHLQWVILPEKRPALRLLWEQTFLPGLARRARLDLLHSLHYTRPWRLPCRSVVTFHDMTFFLFPQLHTRARRVLFPLAIRFSARTADAIITISESTRRDSLRLLGVPPQKIFTTQLGVDPAYRPIRDSRLREEIRQKYGLPENFILYVGLVEPRKNLPVLIQAYRSVLGQGVRHRLVIAGRFGWNYRQVLEEIDRLDLQDLVSFTGYVPRQDLPIVYNLASLFVYPTLYEGFGLPALEALACGTPVITSEVASLPEIMGEAGILIPPGDGQALSQAILSVLSDQALRERMKEKGPQQAAAFTWERTARQTLQVYHHILEHPAPEA